jgi:transmembrane sensor
MQRQEILDLIKRYNAGTCSDDERSLIEDWYLKFEQKGLKDLPYEEREADLNKIWNALPIHRTKTRQINLWYRMAAAAVILLFLSVGIYLVSDSSRKQQQVIQTIARTLTPGGNKAVLTLSNGKQVVLTGALNGQLAKQNNTAITKTAEGAVVYNENPLDSSGSKGMLVYNTMTTPMGGTYALTLSDGTRVTLDAASSIRYPVVFNGAERKVEITGQAYFEVAHNKLKPFRVTTNGQTVEVLGTHFNINAYADEGSTKTTLLEGSVKVSKAGLAALLKPGQQSTTLSNDATIAVKEADTETAVAWKDGLFRFKRADLQTVMRQFARWYNVEVVYDGKIPHVAITGKVQRKASAFQVLQTLNKLDIKFKMEGKKITIL